MIKSGDNLSLVAQITSKQVVIKQKMFQKN